MLNCSADKTYEQVKSTESITSSSIKAGSRVIFGGAVGVIDQLSGKLSFKQNEKVLLANFNSFLKKKSNINANLKQISLEEINGNYYLKGYGDTYKSTMLLEKGDDGSLQSFGVTCTTSACAHNHGCEVTRDATCSACTGDCTKTTEVE